MLELMDGHRGENHISSEDWAVFNEATYGLKSCVLSYGENWKLTMQTATQARVGTGAAIVEGRRVWLGSPELLAIDPGKPGMKRRDAVGIVVKTGEADNPVESAYLHVLKGVENPSQYMPSGGLGGFYKLWEVDLDGVNVAAVRSLRDAVPPLSGVSTPWRDDLVTLAGQGGRANARLEAGVAFVDIESWGVQIPAGAWMKVATLGPEVTPKATWHAVGATTDGSQPVVFSFEATGDLKAYSKSGASYWVVGTSYPAR